MGQNPTPSKPQFQHPISICNIKEVCWWCLGGKKTCAWVVLRAYVCYLCQNRPKTEAEHPPRPPGASISPQILPVACSYDKNTIYIKKGACPDFCPDRPLWNNTPYTHTDMHARAHTCPHMHTRAHTHMHAQTHAHLHTEACTGTRIHTSTHTHTQAHTLTHTHDLKNMVSCNAASQATTLSMGSSELLLRVSIFAVLDLNEMGGTTLPREVLRVSLSGLVSCGWCWGSASGCSRYE